MFFFKPQVTISYYFYEEFIFHLEVWICLAAFIILTIFPLMNIYVYIIYASISSINILFVNNNWFVEMIQFFFFTIHFRKFSEFEILTGFSLSQYKMEEKLHSNRKFKFSLEIRLTVLS